jgi:hypothetical protein
MAVWALSDPHLSFGNAKPMHIFGEQWRNHAAKIESGWRARVAPTDVVLVSGDLSWGRHFQQALCDLCWLDGLPGRIKLAVRGNHDHWWPGSAEERGQLPPTLKLLEGNALLLDGDVFCGTGGWLAPEDPYFEPLDRPSYERELAALERALDEGVALLEAQGDPRRGLHAVLHFPPVTSQGKPTAFDRLLRRFPVRTVTFGHFHLPQEWAACRSGPVDGIHYILAAADFVNFAPTAVPTGRE